MDKLYEMYGKGNNKLTYGRYKPETRSQARKLRGYRTRRNERRPKKQRKTCHCSGKKELKVGDALIIS